MFAICYRTDGTNRLASIDNIMAERRNRDDQGRFKENISDEDIIKVVRSLQPAGTIDIANELDIERQSADYRLRQLVETDDLQKNKIGNSLVWRIQD